jgi:hypothetical protein
MATCGLVDLLAIQHSTSAPPPTYSRGKTRIDYILTSQTKMNAVCHTGILPYNMIFQSYHRGCYIDLDGQILFKDLAPKTAPPKRRGLHINDPRIANKYYDSLLHQIYYHKLDYKIHQLHEEIKLSPTPSQFNPKYD